MGACIRTLIEVLTDTSSSMVASSLSSPQSVRDSSSRSSSIAMDINTSVTRTEFVVKAEARQVIEPEAQLAVEAPSSELSAHSPFLRTESAGLLDTEMLSENHSTEVAPPFVEASSLGNLGNMGGSRRRKDRMTPPAKLSERINTAKQSKAEGEHHASEEDPDFYQDWSGGSRYEVDNKPWSILGWITEGFKNKLQRK